MKWQHECKLDWLKARQSFLTATDVADLLPFTKTGKPRTVTPEMYRKVLSRKLVDLGPSDCVSVGAAARGHLLEPYAIDQLNYLIEYAPVLLKANSKFYHWDDCLVRRAVTNKLAFSPDACDIEQPPDTIVTAHPTMIAEVKSYSAERHVVCGYTSKDRLEERWQIATAMAVCDSIKLAYVVFFNPSYKTPVYLFEYTREDLEDEIEEVKKVEKAWDDYLVTGGSPIDSFAINVDISEKEIIEDIIEKEKLSPVKSIIE